MDDYTQMVLSEMAHQLLSGDGKIRLQAVEGASRSEAYAHKHKKKEEETREEDGKDGQAQGSEKETKGLGEGKGVEEGGGDEDESGQKEQKGEEGGVETEVG
jgi:cobalamin biosynthesis protein CobT